MDRILLYGVPGTGKSTISELLANNLQVPFYELDLLRHNLPQEVKNPYLRLPSTLAWRSLGQLNSKTAVEGFMYVRQALQPYVAQKLRGLRSNFVAESAFVDPHLSQAKIALIVVKSEERHYSQFFIHRQPSIEADQQFKAARFVQDELMKEALELAIPIIDNGSAPEQTLKVLLRSLEEG